MQGFGVYFDIIQATQTPTICGVSIFYIGTISFTLAAISIIAQLWWRIHKMEAPIRAIIQELEQEKIIGFSMLEMFDMLRDHFAIGLTYPQIHSILKSKINRNVAWGVHSSDILATFTTLGLINSSSIDPNHSVLLDNQRTIPNYVYQLTDMGKLLAHKLMSRKPKIDKEGYQSH